MVTASAIPHPSMQGQSFTIGGDEDAQTIATFLRHYTPSIVGASLGHHFVEVGLLVVCVCACMATY